MSTETTLIKVAEPGSTIMAGVYPNPTKGNFTLQLQNSKASAAQVLIFDNKGAVIEQRSVPLTQGNQTLRMNLQGKANGLYLVQVKSASGTETFKVYLQQ